MKLKLVCAVWLSVVLPAFAQHSPYVGEQHREIKSLSAGEVNSLLAGQGMGYAKAAELNGFPGPAHVIELADRLALTPDQLRTTQQLMNEHRERARRLGAEVVAAERELDQLFAERRADAAAVLRASERVGLLQAQLRAEHLNTHLSQTALLNAEQVRRYGELRGYTAGSAPRSSSRHSKHH